MACALERKPEKKSLELITIARDIEREVRVALYL